MKLNLNQSIKLATKAHEGQWRSPTNASITDFESERKEILKSGGSYILKNGSHLYEDKDDKYIWKIRKPYITHPLAVMEMMDTEEEKIVAVLHDIFEDTPAKLVKEEITKRGWHGSLQTTHIFFIKFNEVKYEISSSIYTALSVLNKTKSVKYEDHISDMLYDRYDPYFESTDKLIDKRLWIKVKLADIFHNMSCDPSEHAKQKYLKALPILLKGI